MPINTPQAGISELYLFPIYNTREAYQAATGKEPPPYDPNKPIKSWFDPAAASSPKRNMVYDRVIAYAPNGMPEVGADGKPFTEPLILAREWAATVNISPKVFSSAGVVDPPTTGQEVPVPLRALEPGEELFLQWGGTAAVKNTLLFGDLPGSSTFTPHDRSLLMAIAKKVGAA